MHATTQQLLDLRDGAPVDSVVTVHLQQCEQCGIELERLRNSQQALRNLPQYAPSPQVFEQLRERLINEQRADTRGRLGRSTQWAVAATVVLALVFWMVPDTTNGRSESRMVQVVQEGVTDSAQAVMSSNNTRVEDASRVQADQPMIEAQSTARSGNLLIADSALQRDGLLERSAALEAVAEQLSLLATVEPSDATREALNALNTRLTLVDYNLNAVQIDQYAPTEVNALLNKRVNTLESIVSVQRAELARQGYHGFQVMTASSIEKEQTW